MITLGSVERRLGLLSVAIAIAGAACRPPAPPETTKTAAPSDGPATIEVVRVVEQPLKTQLSLPGELAAYQAVAVYPRVNGFVKTIAVDRGSRVPRDAGTRSSKSKGNDREKAKQNR